MTPHIRLKLAFAAAPLAVMLGCERPPDATTLNVFAAASLAEVASQASREFEARHPGTRVSLNFAGSSTLARQIDAGAPCDVFISANARWIDWLRERGRLAAGSIRPIASNRLVLVVPKGRGFEMPPPKGKELADMFDGRLALGDPQHVPAGLYAREALETLHSTGSVERASVPVVSSASAPALAPASVPALAPASVPALAPASAPAAAWWDGVKDRLAPALDVREALRFVERGEAAAGVVYATDVRGDERVEVVWTFPPESHSPIRYMAARCAALTATGDAPTTDAAARQAMTNSGAAKRAADFLDFLTSERGRRMFAKHGFAAVE